MANEDVIGQILLYLYEMSNVCANPGLEAPTSLAELGYVYGVLLCFFPLSSYSRAKIYRNLCHTYLGPTLPAQSTIMEVSQKYQHFFFYHERPKAVRICPRPECNHGSHNLRSTTTYLPRGSTPPAH
jgi:hypothetical protein